MDAPQASASASAKVRYARLAALATSLSASAVAVMGSLGVVGSTAGPAAAEPRAQGASAVLSAAEPGAPARTPAAPAESASAQADAASEPATAEPEAVEVEPPVPVDSGEGRRVVFDESDQRVWLVGRNGQIRRTYLVSGSIYDNLDPGAYEVYSRSEQAWGIDDSGEMKWFVRFTVGDNAAIGFHSIPTKDGEPLQTRAELGTPTSHGCIRQAAPDAKAMWRFAQMGDTVVVVA